MAPTDRMPPPQKRFTTLADVLRTAAPLPTQPSLTPRDRLKSEAAAMSFLAGEAAERAFFPLCGRYRVAVHEAGHCCADYFTNVPINRVSIVPPDDVVAGYVLGAGAEDYASAIIIPSRSFVSSDRRGALLMLRLGDPSANWKKLRALMGIVQRRADELVGFHRSVISALADRLLQVAEMTGDDVRTSIEAAMRAQGLARCRDSVSPTPPTS